MDQKSESPLTGAERGIVRLISLGCSNKEAAAILGIAEATASNHRTSAMAKLGVQTAGTLTRMALVLGIKSLDDKLTDEEQARLGDHSSGDAIRE